MLPTHTTLDSVDWSTHAHAEGARATLLADPHCDEPQAQADLLRRLKARDADAFEDMVRALSGRMLAVARGLLRCEQEAEDAVQDAFAGAFRNIDQFDGNARLSTWLHRITVNACLMKLRGMGRRPVKQIGALPPELLDDAPVEPPFRSWGEEPESAMQHDELRALVRANIANLPEPFRLILVLRDVEGLSTEEAAYALDITVPAAKTRLHRARQTLRDLLEPLLEAQTR